MSEFDFTHTFLELTKSKSPNKLNKIDEKLKFEIFNYNIPSHYLGANLKIPIYSKLKVKLESKGIDNITSGQIAWFVCSVGIVYLFSIFLYLYGVIKYGISFNRIFVAFYINHFLCFMFMWFVLLLNLLHKANTISLILSILTTIAYLYNPYFTYILVFIICVIMYIAKKQRWLYIYFIGLSYIVTINIIFNLRGGFYK